MKTKWTNCSAPWRAAGLTLIEVVAAIAILGTILVTIVLAKSRHVHQIAQTQRRNVAVRAADELLLSWWASSGGIPLAESGPVASDPSLRWETRLVENDAVHSLGARVVRLEIHDVEPVRLQPGARGEPLIAVELVLPDPQQQARQEPQSQPDGGRARPARRDGVRETAGVPPKGTLGAQQVLEQGGRP